MADAAARALGHVLDGVDAAAQWERAVTLLGSMDGCGVALGWVKLAGAGAPSVLRLEQCRFVFQQALLDARSRRVMAGVSQAPVAEDMPDSRGSSLYDASPFVSDTESISVYTPYALPDVRRLERPQTAPAAMRVHSGPPVPRRPGESAEDYLDRLAGGSEPGDSLSSSRTSRPTTAIPSRIYEDARDAFRDPNLQQPGESAEAFAERIRAGSPVVHSFEPVRPVRPWWQRVPVWPFSAPPRGESEEDAGRAGRINDGRGNQV